MHIFSHSAAVIPHTPFSLFLHNDQEMMPSSTPFLFSFPLAFYLGTIIPSSSSPCPEREREREATITHIFFRYSWMPAGPSPLGKRRRKGEREASTSSSHPPPPSIHPRGALKGPPRSLSDHGSHQEGPGGWLLHVAPPRSPCVNPLYLPISPLPLLPPLSPHLASQHPPAPICVSLASSPAMRSGEGEGATSSKLWIGSGSRIFVRKFCEVRFTQTRPILAVKCRDRNQIRLRLEQQFYL